jgi:hypothetical protein
MRFEVVQALRNFTIALPDDGIAAEAEWSYMRAPPHAPPEKIAPSASRMNSLGEDDKETSSVSPGIKVDPLLSETPFRLTSMETESSNTAARAMNVTSGARGRMQGV